MLCKIFLSLLLLTCVYTYMLGSIEDNKNTIFQNLPDNFNFELNGIQTVKPNLKFVTQFESMIILILGSGFMSKLNQVKIDIEEIVELFNTEALLKIKECQTIEQFENVVNNEMLSKLKNVHFNAHKEIKQEVSKHLERFKDKKFLDFYKNYRIFL